MAASDNDKSDLAKTSVDIINPSGSSNVVIACEHASAFIPASYDQLGLDGTALSSHIAWDPGALGVARTLSDAFDAPLVAQKVSRLVCDCNRPPSHTAFIPVQSEHTKIPGNANLSDAERQARIDQYYQPFHDSLNDIIDQKLTTDRKPVLVTIHSFTPVFLDRKRDVDIGILHDSDARLADGLFQSCTQRATELEETSQLKPKIRRNEPYGPKDGVTHTLVEHGEAQLLLNVMIEIRSDMIASRPQQTDVANWLIHCLSDALTELEFPTVAKSKPAPTVPSD